MPKALELQQQGRDEELWQMCCGYLSLSINEFMDVQERLLLKQIELLNNCELGKKIMRGARPETVEEFRRMVPLTTYKDYCPELIEKRKDILPGKPTQWAHTSGRSGEYPCKWIPLTQEFCNELSSVLFGVGILSSCKRWGDVSSIPQKIKVLYSVAPRPYISGTFADVLRLQSTFVYLPSMEESEKMAFEERIKLGFQQAMSKNMDFFFGLSLVLTTVGEKFRQSSQKVDIHPYLKHPAALWRLLKGLLRSRMAGRVLLPRDLWSLKGIIGSGLDSWVYKDRIKDLWGRYPLDLYSCTEGGVIATQTWDYTSMTFAPNLNFLEFIPEDEYIKWEMDQSYQPNTILLNEVKAGEKYELVITNFHGGAMVRYRLGDIIRITSLKNKNLGIGLPQMIFERRIEDVIDFVFIRLHEKVVWQAIEKTGVQYKDWVAYKKTGESTLHILIEPKDDVKVNIDDITQTLYNEITKSDNETKSLIPEEYATMMDFEVRVTLLPNNAFANYITHRQSEGADIAHLKPPHINPSEEVLSRLLGETEELIVVKKARTEVETAGDETETKEISV